MQKTIMTPIEVSGLAVNGKCQSNVRFEPAEPDSGIVFVRNDLPNKPEIECRVENAFVNERWSSLKKNGVKVEHTEHILAAISGLGISNIRINVDCPYLPVVSSFSSWDFVQALIDAVPITQSSPQKYRIVKKPIWVIDHFETPDGQTHDCLLLGLPAENFSVTYLLDYPDKIIPTQIAHYSTMNESHFLSELANARSFILDQEFDSMKQLFGENVRNCLTLPSSHSKLQWSNEIARHKLLDLIGDLMLTGQHVQGQFIGFRSGHKMNKEIVRLLSKYETTF